MTVITISRQLGSHGDEIATRVAEALGLRLVDADTIHRAAQRAGVPQMALAEMRHEGEHGLANQVLKALQAMPTLQNPFPLPSQSSGLEGGSGGTTGDVPPLDPSAGGVESGYSGLSALTLPFTGLFSPTAPPISASLEEYVRMVGLVIRGLAQEGNVLIIGRGSQALLRNHPGALHVQIVAPLTYRIRVVMAREGLNQRAAQNRVRASDRARFDYVRRYHDADWLDSSLYHLVINSGRVPLAVAVDLIIAAKRAMLDAQDKEATQE
jgi:cytidylate kinase